MTEFLLGLLDYYLVFLSGLLFGFGYLLLNLRRVPSNNLQSPHPSPIESTTLNLCAQRQLSHNTFHSSSQSYPLSYSVIRHGERQHLAESRGGKSNSKPFLDDSLTNLGRQQAEATGLYLRELLKGKRSLLVLSSPMLRTVQTASIMARVLSEGKGPVPSVEIAVECSLMEYLSEGIYPVRPTRLPTHTFPDADKLRLCTHYRPLLYDREVCAFYPETPAALERRAALILDGIQGVWDHVILVTHSHLCAAFARVCSGLNSPLRSAQGFQCKYCSVTSLRRLPLVKEVPEGTQNTMRLSGSTVIVSAFAQTAHV